MPKRPPEVDERAGANAAPDGAGQAQSPSSRRQVRGDLREIVRPWVMLLPAVIVIVTLFVGAIVLAILQSLEWMPLIGQTDLTLDSYEALFTRAEFWPSLALTLYLGVVSTLIAVVFGVAFALMLRRLAYRFRFLTFLFQINLPVPHVVSATAILLLFSQSGTFARAAAKVSLIEHSSDFPLLVFDPWALGIITSFSWKEVPFITVIALAQLRSVVTDYEEVARMLGAGPWQRLRHVTVPLIMPGVLTASVIVFAFTFGSYEVPLLLGRSYPSTLPVLAVKLHSDVDLLARPQGMAITVVVAAITVAMVGAYMKLARSRIRREGR